MSSPSFRTHYPLETYGAYRAHHADRPRKPDGGADFDSSAYKAWSAEYRTHCDAAGAAIQAFLLELRASRELALVPHMYRRTHRLAQAWNALAQGEQQPYQLEHIARSLSYALFVAGSVHIAEDAPLERAYEALITTADDGTFDWCYLNSQDECQTTGERIHFELQEWRPRLGIVDHTSRDRDLVPLRPIPLPKVFHHVIQAPSGELLIADWFRHDAFTQAVKDPASEDCSYSVNNDLGKLRQTAWYAQRHGFMSVFVGNTLPRIVERGDHFAIARVDEDGELGEPPIVGHIAGSVCTDLWWATVIDRQVLTDILSRSMPAEAAQHAVVDMLEDSYSTITTLKVTPGVLHVYHTAHDGDMQGFRSPDVPDSSIEQLWAVVSTRELSWTPKSASAAESTTPSRKAKP
tara:strand:- start:1002 stop:2219 length:1218 start_codon:yes stop_codon:yes gene_type:complete